ncbi:DUF1682 domain containing protein [Pyrenophora tritici-repentis]|uniref:DUF1682 domain containing protein n=1 Tax=Pyrenophora tritici-repentis TaxID=45151 RepID=A0A922SZ53_9PLEO|nr:DUF1682 domain containing protein [Pyrenophora tritici-repentis]
MIKVEYVPSDNMIADGFTKPLPANKWARFLDQLGLVEREEAPLREIGLKEVQEQLEGLIIHQYEARKLRSSVHHLSVQYKLLQHENEGLKEALQHKKKHKKKGKALDLQQRQEYHGGSVFWSPRKIREARAREVVRERDKIEEKLQKAQAKKQREEVQLQRQVKLEEKRVERQRLKEIRELERAEKAAERARKVEAQHQKKATQQAQQRKRKASRAPSSKNKRQKRAMEDRARDRVASPPSPPPPKTTSLNVSRATITNLINQAYDPSSIAANNLSEILLRLQAAKEIAEYEKDALRAALHVHQKPRNRHEPPLDLQQRKAQLVKEKEKEKELLDKIELKEAKENNRIYQLKIKEAARAAREEAKKVRDEAKAVKAAELDAKRRDRDAAKAIQQP